MEIGIYSMILLISLVFAYDAKPLKSERLFLISFFVVYLVYVLVIRASGYEEDIKHTYAPLMESEIFNFRMFREPILWLGQRALYDTLGNTFVVFVMTDFLAGILLYRAYRNLDMPQYSFFTILTFFPFVMGIQNLYRQWLAQIIFIYAVSLLRRGELRAYLFAIVSVLTHNVGGLFGGIFLLFSPRKILRLASIVLLATTPVALYFFEDFASEAQTGADLSEVYLLVTGLILAAIISLDRGKLRLPLIWEYILLLYVLALGGFCLVFLAPAQVERTVLFGFFVVYPFLLKRIEGQFVETFFVRALAIIAGFVPMLLFSVRFLIL